MLTHLAEFNGKQIVSFIVTFFVVLAGFTGCKDSGTGTNDSSVPVVSHVSLNLLTDQELLVDLDREAVPEPKTSTYEPGAGITYYVDVSGDNNADGSQARPWRTIDYALSQVSGGDTIRLNAGVFEPVVQFRTKLSFDKWVTVIGDSSGDSIIPSILFKPPRLVDVGIANSTEYVDSVDLRIRFDHVVLSPEYSGVELYRMRYFDIRNSLIQSKSRYNGRYGLSIYQSEEIVIHHNEITQINSGISVAGSANVHISNNKIHGIVGSGIKFGAKNNVRTAERPNAGFVIENNHIYDSNYDPAHYDFNPRKYPHASCISVRSNHLIFRKNICHDIGSSSGIMFYSSAGGLTVYKNITIENNLFYDIQNGMVFRLYNIGKSVYVRNNTVIGHIRENSNNGNYKLRVALSTSIADPNNPKHPSNIVDCNDGCTPDELHVYNNIFLGTVQLLNGVDFQNNIMWSLQKEGIRGFASDLPGADSIVITNERVNYPQNFYLDELFADGSIISLEKNHHNLYDFSLSAGGIATSLGSESLNANGYLGQLDTEGFIIDSGQSRPPGDTSVGAYPAP